MIYLFFNQRGWKQDPTENNMLRLENKKQLMFQVSEKAPKQK